MWDSFDLPLKARFVCSNGEFGEKRKLTHRVREKTAQSWIPSLLRVLARFIDDLRSLHILFGIDELNPCNTSENHNSIMSFLAVETIVT